MTVNEIHYLDRFKNQFSKLPLKIKKSAIKKEALFRENPLHPSLKLHKLKGKLDGCWSISINRAYRIIFKPKDDGNIIFITVGTHAIYE